MKTKIILVLVSLSFNLVINSQTTTAKTTNASGSHTQFGIKAGVNIATINVDEDNTDYDSRTGFHVGGLAHIHITTNFALQPEVMYSTQGAEWATTRFKNDYINIPVLIQYMTNNGFRIQTGPQVGFLISAKNKIANVEIDVKDQMNTVDFAWTFGTSYLSKTGLGLDARYNLGISNRTENESFPKSRNRVWQIGAFYQFSH